MGTERATLQAALDRAEDADPESLLSRVLTMELHYGTALREQYPFGWELVRRAAGLPPISGFPKAPPADEGAGRLDTMPRDLAAALNAWLDSRGDDTATQDALEDAAQRWRLAYAESVPEREGIPGLTDRVIRDTYIPIEGESVPEPPHSPEER